MNSVESIHKINKIMFSEGEETEWSPDTLDQVAEVIKASSENSYNPMWVLRVTGPGDEMVTAYQTQEMADEALNEFCRQTWRVEDDGPMPEEDLMYEFFELYSHEYSYNISVTHLHEECFNGVNS